MPPPRSPGLSPEFAWVLCPLTTLTTRNKAVTKLPYICLASRSGRFEGLWVLLKHGTDGSNARVRGTALRLHVGPRWTLTSALKYG